MLKREDILGVVDIPREEISVPEWGGSVMVYGLNGTERDAFEISIAGNGRVELANLRARLCAISIRDETGDRIFNDKDCELLGKKSAQALQRVFEVAQRLSGLTAGDVDALSKNSNSAPKGASGSV